MLVLLAGQGGFLRGPVVNVPVIFVQKQVVLLELFGRHGAEVGGGEGGEDQVGFEGAAFARLV